MLRLEPRAASWFAAQAHLARYHALLLRGDVAGADRALQFYGVIARSLRIEALIWEHDRLRAQGLLHAGELEQAERRFDELWSAAAGCACRMRASSTVSSRAR